MNRKDLAEALEGAAELLCPDLLLPLHLQLEHGVRPLAVVVLPPPLLLLSHGVQQARARQGQF